ncbi:MAG: glycosyltransferase [Candidatus Omnitrophica bacterium]|nr:glycosyltransferase [Candidatus Omnitrophota bacterium]MBU4333347.1 glycosyltransferase [Candidatus Omnitrophota bacterium]
MKILYISNHNPNFNNSNIFREDAIRQLGHDLIFFEDRDFLFPGRLRDSYKIFRNIDLNIMEKKLIKTIKAADPDICLFVGGGFFKTQTLKEIQSMKFKSILWTTDPLSEFYTDYICKNAFCFDHIFYAGTEAKVLLDKLGYNNSSWLPFACNPNFHKPVILTSAENEIYKRDIAFVGSYYPNREQVLESISDYDLGVWGPFWSRVNKISQLASKVIDTRLNYTEWIKIYSAAKIVIVSHYDDGKTPCLQASPKVFEALACKSFILIDNQKDALSMFKDKQHLVFFDNKIDLREKIQYYLNNAEERLKIAENGYREVLASHTYKKRIEELLRKVNTFKK